MSPGVEEGPLKEAAILTRAVENVFRKLIRLLIGRMSLTRLQEMIRIIFVEEAESNLRRERPGKNVPLTRMALLTGLDTRTLNKVIEKKKKARPLHKEDKFLREITPEGSVLDYWSCNPKYLDSDKTDPLILKLRGEAPSFESLVKDTLSSRGVTIGSLLARLEKSESVEIDRISQTVKLLNSKFLPFGLKVNTASLEIGFVNVGQLVETVVHNFETKEHASDSFFQRSNWTYRLDKNHLSRFKREIREYLSVAEEGARHILGKYEEQDIKENQITAGVSMFYFEEDLSN